LANDKRNTLRDLAEATQKAVRRGEKLEKTLLKIVAQSETGSAAEELLKALRRGMKKLKKGAKEIDQPILPVKKKKAVPSPKSIQSTPAKSAPRPVKRARKKPQPDTAPATASAAPNE
jgi:hypothetical protein